MKKWFVYAFVALFVTACGNKTKETEELLDSLMIAGDTILAESEALPPMFCVGHDSKYHLVLYWTDVKEPKKTKDNEEWFDEIYKKWALQEILRRNAEQYTNLLVGKDIVKVKYVDEILKDPDGNTPSIGQMHVRNDIPSLCARFDVVDAKNRKKAENGVVLVTDEYLETHTRLSVKSMNTSTKKLPANVVKSLEKKYGMSVSRSVLVATIGDKYSWGAVQFKGEYKKASKGKDDDKACLALNVLTDGKNVWSTEEIGYYISDGEMGWNVDDDGEYIPCDIAAAFEGPKGIELCYTHGAPESYEVGMFYQRNNEMVQDTYEMYQTMIDEVRPIWKKDFAIMDKMYHADDGSEKDVVLSKWAHCYIDYGNEWIWLRDSDDKHGAFFIYKDGKYQLIAVENFMHKPSRCEKDGISYLKLSGPAGGPAWNTVVYAFKDGKRLWRLTVLEVYGEIDGCWLNNKEISKEEGSRYMESIPEGEDINANFINIPK